MWFSKNPKSLLSSKLRGRARTPTAGGVRAPAEVGAVFDPPYTLLTPLTLLTAP